MRVDEKELQAHLERLRQYKGLIIVEGKKDVRSLADLGIMNVIPLEGALFEVVERVAALTKDCMVLTDLDEEGRKLYHELATHLMRHGVHVDNTFREFLFTTPVRHIEGLSTFVMRKA
ncbi:MAG: toprim domain-containing protein [Nanoarchaeota archaeon]